MKAPRLTPNEWIPEGTPEPRRSVLEVALREVGTREATGKNDGPAEKYMPAWAHGQGLPWCAWFVGWAWKQAMGVPLYGRHWGGAWDLFKEGHPDHTETPSPGDVFIILHDGQTERRGPGHVGLITRVSLDGLTVNTVEGNIQNAVGVATRATKTFAAVLNPYGSPGPAPSGLRAATWAGKKSTR